MSYPLINGAAINGEEGPDTGALVAIELAAGVLGIGLAPESLVAVSISDQVLVYPQRSFSPVSLIAINIAYHSLVAGQPPAGTVFLPESLVAVKISAQEVHAQLTLATPESLTAVALSEHGFGVGFPGSDALTAIEVGDFGMGMRLRPDSLIAIDTPGQAAHFRLGTPASLEAIRIGPITVSIGGIGAGDSDSLEAIEIADGGLLGYGFRPRTLYAIDIPGQNIGRSTAC